MAFKDPDAQRAFQNAWMTRRRAAWLAGQRCRCGLRAAHVVSRTPKAPKVPWGAGPAKRDAVIAEHYEAVCDQHATAKERAARARRPEQKSPAGDTAARPEPEPEEPELYDPDGPFDAAARRAWRRERRARLGYGATQPGGEG